MCQQIWTNDRYISSIFTRHVWRIYGRCWNTKCGPSVRCSLSSQFLMSRNSVRRLPQEISFPPPFHPIPRHPHAPILLLLSSSSSSSPFLWFFFLWQSLQSHNAFSQAGAYTLPSGELAKLLKEGNPFAKPAGSDNEPRSPQLNGGTNGVGSGSGSEPWWSLGRMYPLFFLLLRLFQQMLLFLILCYLKRKYVCLYSLKS